MFRKKNAFWGWLAALIITLLFIFSWQGLKFNYDFKNFFSQNDPDLDFYIELRKTFENDNDYLLISLGNSPGIFEREFLDKSLEIENQIKSLNNVDRVFALLADLLWLPLLLIPLKVVMEKKVTGNPLSRK